MSEVIYARRAHPVNKSRWYIDLRIGDLLVYEGFKNYYLRVITNCVLVVTNTSGNDAIYHLARDSQDLSPVTRTYPSLAKIMDSRRLFRSYLREISEEEYEKDKRGGCELIVTGTIDDDITKVAVVRTDPRQLTGDSIAPTLDDEVDDLLTMMLDDYGVFS